MYSHEAIHKAINGRTIDHARALHLASSTIHKWQEPSNDFTDSGSLNPLDRIETIVQTSLSFGMASEHSLAPIHYLAERFNLAVIAMPKSSGCVKEIVRELLATIEEFGDLTKAVSSSIEDNDVRKFEARKVSKEGWELIRKVCALMARVEEAAK